MTAERSGPVDAAEFDRLVRPLLGADGPPRLALAVSGGPDSLALMHIAAGWLRAGYWPPRAAQGEPLLVITVDHRLRPESADEALMVAAQARELGLAHATLRWTSPKPLSAVQAAARAERYRLVHEHLKTEALADHAPMRPLLTAHTADDQGETLLMRLMRGSGIDGLAGMRPRTRLRVPAGEESSSTPPEHLTVLRPLLGVPRLRLVETLRQLGATWIDDPSNENEAFERIRVRKALEGLREVGLERKALALSATRLGRAASAVEAGAQRLARDAVDHHQGSHADIDLARLLAAPPELAIRVLLRTLTGHGGAGRPEHGPRLAQVEDLYEAACAPAETRPARFHGVSLAGCTVELAEQGGRKTLRVVRETGRAGLPTLRLVPGRTQVWDRRFTLVAGDGVDDGYEIRALGRSGLAALKATYPSVKDLKWPDHILIAMPSLWQGGSLLAVPHVGRVVPGLMGPLRWLDVGAAETAARPAARRTAAEPEGRVRGTAGTVEVLIAFTGCRDPDLDRDPEGANEA